MVIQLSLFLAIAIAAPYSVASYFAASNLGFEAWNADKTKPDIWAIYGAGYETVADCDAALNVPEGKCALRLRSTSALKEGGYVVLSQYMLADVAVGYQLKLTGFIRTENVDGSAAMFMSVVAPTKKMIAFDEMKARQPQGTTGWNSFEIVVPVASSTSTIVIGAKMAGAGTAWFDDLKLSVDKSVEISRADVATVSAVEVPPRSIIPYGLLDDKALAITDAPIINDAWRSDIEQRHHAIRSLASDDFSDLQFLKPLLKRKRVVQLGESGHGIAEFSWLKVRLIKFLHQQLGYDVIAFESSLTGCDNADKLIGKATPMAVMRECVFSNFSTEQVLTLFEYFEAARRAGKRLNLAGFDTQNSGMGQKEVGERFKKFLQVNEPGLALKIDANEKCLRFDMPAAEAEELTAFYRELADALTKNRVKLRHQFKARPDEIDLAIQEAKSRVVYVAQMLAGSEVTGGVIRDEGMANNLDFLLDKLYPGRKVIVWAHNYHITYKQAEHDQPHAMGAWVAQRRKAEVYTVGLFMGRGIGAMNDQALYEILPPEKNSLEAIMANAGRKMSFVDFSRVKHNAGNGWIFEPTTARSWGITPIKITPASMYDAVIYIDQVTPPQYINAP